MYLRYLFAEQQFSLFNSKSNARIIYPLHSLCLHLYRCCMAGWMDVCVCVCIHIKTIQPLLKYTKLVKCYYKIAFLFNCTRTKCVIFTGI